VFKALRREEALRGIEGIEETTLIAQGGRNAAGGEEVRTMPLQFEARLGGALGQGLAAFKESLEKKLAAQVRKTKAHGPVRQHDRTVSLYALGPQTGAFSGRANLCHCEAVPFNSGKQIIEKLEELSRTGPIDRVNFFDHGTVTGIIGGNQNSIGLYIGNPTNPVYHTLYRDVHGNPLVFNYDAIFNTGDRGQRSAEQLARAIAGGSINLAPSASITFFGCNSDGIASHLEFILNALGRGDISVTGASGEVYPINGGTASAVSGGWWNSYQHGRFRSNRGRRMSNR
jgi:hypothetical protein